MISKNVSAFFHGINDCGAITYNRQEKKWLCIRKGVPIRANLVGLPYSKPQLAHILSNVFEENERCDGTNAFLLFLGLFGPCARKSSDTCYEPVREHDGKGFIRFPNANGWTNDVWHVIERRWYLLLIRSEIQNGRGGNLWPEHLVPQPLEQDRPHLVWGSLAEVRQRSGMATKVDRGLQIGPLLLQGKGTRRILYHIICRHVYCAEP